MILSERAQFDLARRLRSRERATLGEVFAFLSGLYFRGKLAYANTFARTAEGICGVLVITPTRGLVDAATRVSLRDLREFAEVDIHEDDPRYREPLARDARRNAKLFCSAVSPPASTSMFYWRIFKIVCAFQRTSLGAAT